MKSLMKKFKKITNNKYRPNKRLRYKYKDYSYKINKYQQSLKPATFGPGSYKFCISKIINGPLNSEVQLPLYSQILVNNPEFERIQTEFKYIKMHNLSLNFYPRNVIRTDNSNLSPCYFLINYDGEVTRNLRVQDSVKIVPAFHSRNKIFKFKFPYIEAGSGLLNSWQAIDSLGKFENVIIQMHAPDNTTDWYVRIDVNVTVRGPTSSQATVLKTTEIRSINWDSDKEKEEYLNKLEILKNKINELNQIKENNIEEKEEIKENKKEIKCEKECQTNVKYGKWVFGNSDISEEISIQTEEIFDEENYRNKKENEIKEKIINLDKRRLLKYKMKNIEIDKKIKEISKEIEKKNKEIKDKNRIISDKNKLIEEDKKIIDMLASNVDRSMSSFSNG